MKICLDKNVYEAALDRMRYIFSEFPNVVVGFSGGKDSTIIFNLAVKVAEELNRLPLSVMFLDQEAEWEATIDIVKTIMYDRRVKSYWLQIPFRLYNATSNIEPWLECWGVGKKWIRDKDPIAITENIYGNDRFHGMFGAFMEVTFKGQKACYLSGVRTPESPSRYMALTSALTYKSITWGKILNKKQQHYTFYPIYDWGLSDVWKAINDNDWKYNKLYDYMYQYGVNPQAMRVSNVHHEQSVVDLFFLQELEPQTYDKLVQRIGGIQTAGKMGKDDYFVRELPFMFTSWKEYRDYLTEHLIAEEYRQLFRDKFAEMDDLYDGYPEYKKSCIKIQIDTILTNDRWFVKLDNFEARPANYHWRKHHSKKKTHTLNT